MRLKTASIQKSYTTLVGLHHIPNPSPQRASPSMNFMDLANAVTLVSRIHALFLTHTHRHLSPCDARLGCMVITVLVFSVKYAFRQYTKSFTTTRLAQHELYGPRECCNFGLTHSVSLSHTYTHTHTHTSISL